MGYKIGSFNLKNIGATALGKSTKNLELIANIILKEKFDVVALQEVLSEGKAFTAEYTKKSILNYLGKNWDFRWADVNTERVTDKRGEGYAFLWNKNRLQLSKIALSNGKTRVFNPRTIDINKEDMVRKPFYARFTPVGTLVGGPRIELRLICVHTYYGDDSNKARNIRQRELDVLLKDIYPRISDRRYGVYGNGMPSYTILLGDYNVILKRPWKEKAYSEIDAKRQLEGKRKMDRPAELVVDEDGDIVISRKWDNRRIKTVQDQFTTLQPDNDRGYINDYDHFSYDEEQFKDVWVSAKRIDAVRKYCKDDFTEYFKSVSDHIPIQMVIELNCDMWGNEEVNYGKKENRHDREY
ncbi:Endonuclease/Exonuclease/phosphatase family protein [Eubacterium ruminantium]|nr:Endonuclease/Exonuclease/phosphatase family protein [Eubacterium ruminantium]